MVPPNEPAAVLCSGTADQNAVPVLRICRAADRAGDAAAPGARATRTVTGTWPGGTELVSESGRSSRAWTTGSTRHGLEPSAAGQNHELGASGPLPAVAVNPSSVWVAVEVCSRLSRRSMSVTAR